MISISIISTASARISTEETAGQSLASADVLMMLMIPPRFSYVRARAHDPGLTHIISTISTISTGTTADLHKEAC